LPGPRASYHPLRRSYNSSTQHKVHLNQPLHERPQSPHLHVVDDALFDQHRARGPHPERPERLGAARRAVESCVAAGLSLTRVVPRDATMDELARVHRAQYLETLEQLRGHHVALDPDTYVVPISVDAARRAAGSAIALVEALLDAPAPADAGGRTGVALLRPPGHHATRDTGMGFCLLNNVAVAAQAALKRGISRVAVVDFDVHHGNGTQDIFWDDPRVLFLSLHQWPFYPGTGAAEQVGAGEGTGYTVNVPLSDGANDAVYEAAFDELVVPILEEYGPELILVSAGYDAHERDPLAGMKLTRGAYASMAKRLAAAAARSAGGRLAFFLEGGYDIPAIETSIAASLLAATGRGVEPRTAQEEEIASPPVSARHRADLDRTRRQARLHWPRL
jgi:acetoin utilization deacetylase AcuC-like enzyme